MMYIIGVGKTSTYTVISTVAALFLSHSLAVALTLTRPFCPYTHTHTHTNTDDIKEQRCNGLSTHR